MPIGPRDEIGRRDPGAQDRAGQDGRQEDAHDRIDRPHRDRDQGVVPAEEEVRELGRGRGALIADEARGVAEGRAHEHDGRHENDLDGRDRGEDPESPLRDETGEENRDQGVGADDVPGEDGRVDESEQEHPPPSSPYEPSRIIIGLPLESADPSCADLLGKAGNAGVEFGGAGADAGLAPADHHRHESESEEEGEEGVGPVVDEEFADQQPPPIASRGGDRFGEEAHPEGGVRHRDEEQHEAAGHVGGGVADRIRSRE